MTNFGMTSGKTGNYRYIYIWLCNSRVSWASRSQLRYPGLESRLRQESFCFSFYLSRYCRHIICLTLSVIIIKLKLSLIWNEIRRRMTQKRLCGKCSLQQRVNSRHIHIYICVSWSGRISFKLSKWQKWHSRTESHPLENFQHSSKLHT